MMAFTPQIPANLIDLWKTKSAEQKAVIRLCEAAAAGEVDEAKVCCFELRASCSR